MKNRTFSSPEVRTLANISQQTLERYMREFTDFYFSEGARSHTRGRRFDERDLKNVLLIRRMKITRRSHDEIVSALVGDHDIDPMGQAWIDRDQILGIAVETLETSKKNDARIRKLETSTTSVSTFSKLYSDHLNTKHRLNQTIETLNKLNKLFTKEIYGEAAYQSEQETIKQEPNKDQVLLFNKIVIDKDSKLGKFISRL